MRNLQKNLIPKWNSANKVSQLIEELPNLCNDFEYQIGKSLLPNLGEYSINSYNYDINDILRNQNNKCYKILIPIKNGEEGNITFYNRYMVITTTTFIILESINDRYKNICKINYIGNLFEIEKIERFIEEKEEYKDLVCFKINWNKNSNNQLNYTICGDSKKLIVKNITDLLLKRKKTLTDYFKYIQNNESGTIKMYEEIIKIKEKLVEDKTNDFIYEEINTLYQKIIEVLSSYNGDEFKKYLEKLQKFMNSYDKLKIEENKKKEFLKGKGNNINNNGANPKKK
jgi:hypothetical protein